MRCRILKRFQKIRCDVRGVALLSRSGASTRNRSSCAMRLNRPGGGLACRVSAGSSGNSSVRRRWSGSPADQSRPISRRTASSRSLNAGSSADGLNVTTGSPGSRTERYAGGRAAGPVS
jgi:hypothetical protein